MDVAPSKDPIAEELERLFESDASGWRRGFHFSPHGERATYQLDVDGLFWVFIQQAKEDPTRWTVTVHPAGAHWGGKVEEGAQPYETRGAAAKVGLGLAGQMLLRALQRVNRLGDGR